MVITSSGMLFLENNSMIDATSISKKVFFEKLVVIFKSSFGTRITYY